MKLPAYGIADNIVTSRFMMRDLTQYVHYAQ